MTGKRIGKRDMRRNCFIFIVMIMLIGSSKCVKEKIEGVGNEVKGKEQTEQAKMPGKSEEETSRKRVEAAHMKG